MRQGFGVGALAVMGLLGLLGGIQPSMAQAPSGSNGSCMAVGGTFIIDFIDQTTAVGFISGDLQGGLRGVVLKSEAGDKRIVKFTTEHAIVTSGGDLIRTSDQSVFTPVQDKLGVLTQTQTITGGSGRFANATGTLTEVGTLDMAAGQGVLRYTGQVCTKAP